MIKVVKQGIKPKKVIWKVVCSKCDCEIEFETEDVERDYYIRSRFRMECPCCGQTIIKSFNKLTKKTSK